ncbi:acetate/propionate family kinase [Nonomuraea sp. NPDC050556]|uniref:acetate/propionate family kinase n=1 Tax=Nonomuraea sp. NPDC050556 TaxID=3364369 RepID=UPI0037AB86ED
MAVLVLNTGSSTIKYELIDVGSGERLREGLAERVGDHTAALKSVLEALGGLTPEAVGHRVVHGGTRFRDPVLIDDEVMAAIDELSPLAPLHNPVNLDGIRAAQHAFPGVPQVAVFDTAFHHTLPPEAYTYAVPREWGVRRFGFHGTSCAYVTRRATELLGEPYPNLIVLHLGNGASATAVEAGRSVDTSMGLTPLEGLVMGTRSGDVDPGLPHHLGFDLDHALNHASGLLALAGEADMREVRRRADGGDPDAVLARQVYCRRIRKYVGAYYALLGRVDAIVFTAGVGEHDAGVRAAALSGLERLGITVDAALNDQPSEEERAVSRPGAEVAVLVIPTDEEGEIARQTLDLVRTAP